MSESGAPAVTGRSASLPAPIGLYRVSEAAAPEVLFGPPPPAAVTAEADAMPPIAVGQRPVARQLGEELLLRVCRGPDSAWLWRLPLSPGLDRMALIRGYATLGAESATDIAAGAGAGAAKPPSLHAGLMIRLGQLPRRRPRRWLKSALTVSAAETGWSGLAAIRCRAGRRCEVFTLDAHDSRRAEAIAAVVDAMREAGERARDVPAQGAADLPMPLQLYREEFGLKDLRLRLPDGEGVGLWAESDAAGDEVEFVRGLLTLGVGQRAAWIAPGRARQTAIAAGLAAAVFLLWPVAGEVGATATLRPAESRVVVAEQAGRLVRLAVQVGDTVSAGDPIAALVSPELEEQRQRASLDAMLESLGGREAMAEGDYGRYQLVQQREEIAALRLAQGERRLAALQLTAPVDGRIADHVPYADVGVLKPVGSFIAEVQIGDAMHVTLTVADGDAALLRADQTGELMVRGVVDRRYPVRLLGAPVARTTAEGERELVVMAEVLGDADPQLFKGLSGYARIDTGTLPRIADWLRPLYEYLRLTAWKFLGLPV